jgi:putative component of membrane protein insertase Oxa1/YidC/SpoIIIJ protein YidD
MMPAWDIGFVRESLRRRVRRAARRAPGLRRWGEPVAPCCSGRAGSSVLLIRGAQRSSPPTLPASCRLRAALGSLEAMSARRGARRLVGRRLLRHPFNRGGFDPVRDLALLMIVASYLPSADDGSAGGPALFFKRPPPPVRRMTGGRTVPVRGRLLPAAATTEPPSGGGLVLVREAPSS